MRTTYLNAAGCSVIEKQQTLSQGRYTYIRTDYPGYIELVAEYNFWKGIFIRIVRVYDTVVGGETTYVTVRYPARSTVSRFIVPSRSFLDILMEAANVD